MRYIRFTFTDFDVFQELRVAEIEVYDTSNGEVASGVSVVASSEETENEFLPASNVNDGDTNSEWSIAAGAWPTAWIYFDLGSSLTELQKYRFWLLSTQIGPTAWTVETADSPAGPWTFVESRVQDPPTYGAWMEFTPPVAIQLVPGAGVVGVRGALPAGGAEIALLPAAGVAGVLGSAARRGPVVSLEALAGVVGVLGATPAPGPALRLVPGAAVVGVRGATPYPLLILTDPTAVSIYRCYLDLTGDRVELPIATVQTRLQEVGTSFLAVTVPNGLSLIDAIRARAGGNLSLWRGVRTRSGQEVLTEIVNAPLTSTALDAGARSSTITLNARETLTVDAPKRVTLTDVQSYSDRDGTLRVRAGVDEHLRPGDTAVFDGGEFAVVSVLILESARGLSSMEVGG